MERKATQSRKFKHKSHSKPGLLLVSTSWPRAPFSLLSLPCYPATTLQVKLNPLHSLHKSLLLTPSLPLITELSSRSKSMLNTLEKVDLIWNPNLLQDLLALPSQLLWENGIGLRCTDSPWTLDTSQLIILNERWMSDIRHLNKWLAGLLGGNSDWWVGVHPACGVFGAKAVADRCDTGVSFGVKVGDCGGDDWIDGLGGVWVVAPGTLGEPGHEVKVVWAVELKSIAVEKIRHDGVVAVGGELIGHQLGVLPDTDDVWQEENRLLSLNLLLWLGDVSLDVVLKMDRAAGWFSPVDR